MTESELNEIEANIFRGHHGDEKLALVAEVRRLRRLIDMAGGGEAVEEGMCPWCREFGHSNHHCPAFTSTGEVR